MQMIFWKTDRRFIKTLAGFRRAAQKIPILAVSNTFMHSLVDVVVICQHTGMKKLCFTLLIQNEDKLNETSMFPHALLIILLEFSKISAKIIFKYFI